MTLNYLSESEVIPNETLALSPVKLPGSLEKDTPLSQMNPYLDISAIEMPSPIVHYIPIESPKKRQNLFNPQSKIISVLKKTERTYNEAVFIYKFLKDFSFFKKFKQDNPKLRSTEALIHLCRRLEYHVYSPGTTIYRKGDPSNGRVYMVYSGKVDLCDVIPKKNFDASPQSINRPEKSLKANRSSFKDDSKTPKSSKNLNKFSEQAKVELSARVINSHPSHPENFFLHPARVNSARKKSFINSTNESLSPEKHGKKTTPKGGRTLKRPNMPLLTLLKSEQEIDKRTPTSGNFEGFSEVFKLRASAENLDTVTSHSLRRRHLSGRNNGDTPSSTLESDTPVSRKEIWEKSMPASSYQKNNYVPEVKSIFKKSSPKSIIVNNDTEEEDEDDEILEEEVFEAIINQGHYSNHMKSERDVRVRRRVVVKGELFGEEVLHDASPDFEEIVRKFTVEVVGERELGLLSFKREDYEYMLTRYSYKNTKVVDFLLDNIPYLEKSVKERKIFEMEGIFLEEGLNWKQLVTAQGQKGSKIYMLFEGLCEISKEVKISDTACASTCPSLVDATKKENNGLSKDYGWNTKMMKIPICEVKAGVFLGEEILFNNTGEYEYSVKASTTQIKLLGIEKETFLEIMPEPVQNGLRSLYNQKREHNDEILAAKVKMQVNMQQARSIVLDNYENNKEDPTSKQAVKSQNMVLQSAKSLFTIPDIAGEEKRKNKVQTPSTTTEIKTRLNTAEVEKSHRRSIAGETGVFFRDSFAKEIAKEPKTDVSKKMNRRRPILSAKPDNTLRSENSQTSVLRRQRQSLVIKPSESSVKTKEKEVEKNLISSAINSPSGDFTSIKFDFGRDVNDTIGSKVYHDLEKGKEEKTVLKMKKNMMDRQKANQSAKSSAHKLSNFLNSSKSIFGVESASTVWLQSPKTVLSGATNSFAFSPSSSKAKDIILQEQQVALSFRRENTARISIEKRGRAFSVKNVEQPPPLKTELREAYPIIEIKGKSMPWKHRLTRRSLASDELK